MICQLAERWIAGNAAVGRVSILVAPGRPLVLEHVCKDLQGWVVEEGIVIVLPYLNLPLFVMLEAGSIPNRRGRYR